MTTTLVLIFSYMFVYNLALYLVFFSLFQFISFNFKTLHSFKNLNNNFINKVITISILSMAGVPPFIGFFSKVFLFILLVDSNFFVFFFFFFVLIFTGLYFYIQNIRLLNGTGESNFPSQHVFNLRVSTVYYSTALLISFFLIFGFVFVEDLFTFFFWLVI